MQWNTSYVESVFSFANNINTHEGGTHLSGFRAALTGDAEPLCARQGPAQGEGGQPRGRGRPRGSRCGDLGQAPQPAVRGPDEDEARQPADRESRQAGREPAARRVPGGESAGRPADRGEGDLRPARTPGGPQGARADPPQERAREHVAARQARRLLDQGSRGGRALHRRGRLRRRLGQDGPRPHLPGDPAAPRKDHQLGEEPDQQGSLEQRDPGDDHRDRNLARRRVRHREAPLPQGDRDDGRRRGRVAHPDVDPDVPLPPDAGADRARTRLHRSAAALQGEARQPGVLLREGRPARGAARAGASGRSRGRVLRRRAAQAHGGSLGPLRARARRVRGLARPAPRRLWRRAGRLHGHAPPRRDRVRLARRARRRRDRDDRQRLRADDPRARGALDRGQGRRDRDERGHPCHRSGRARRFADLRQSAQGLRQARRGRGHAAVHARLREEAARGRDVRGASRRGARAREGGFAALSIQGPRRDERGAALGDDDGSAEAAADPRRRRGCLGGRPALLDPDGRPGRTAPRVHRGERPRRALPRCLHLVPGRPRQRPDRAARARAGDALELSRLRDERDRRARAARRAGRPQAGAPPRPLRDARGGSPAEPALQEVRCDGRRRDGQVPPPRRRLDLRHPRPDGAAVQPALPARRRTGQLRLGRRRPAGGDALHRGATCADRDRDAARHRRRHRRLRPELRRVAARARTCSRPASPTCS